MLTALYVICLKIKLRLPQQITCLAYDEYANDRSIDLSDMERVLKSFYYTCILQSHIDSRKILRNAKST